MKRLVVWVLFAAMVLGMSSLAVGKRNNTESAPLVLDVDRHTQVIMWDSAFHLKLHEPRERGASFESSEVRFTVVTNDKVKVSITQNFTRELREHFRLSEADLKNILNPRLKLTTVAKRGRNHTKVYDPLKDTILLRVESAGSHTYEMSILMDWNRNSDWWEITPVKGAELGRVYVTIEAP